MEKTKQAVHKLSDIKEKLVCAMEGELANGIQNVNTEEAGAVIDMIKDLADAEKNCYKACYYKSIIETMEEAKEDIEDEEMPWWARMFNPEMMRAGYDNWRYSSGRFAPKGRGHRSGYIPSTDGHMMRMPTYHDGSYPDYFGDNPRMGYGTRDGKGMYGDSYVRYRDAMRHYTDSHSKQDRDEADMRAKEHMAEAMDTFRDIWKDADPELRKKMKADLTNLLGGMAT